MNPSEIRTVRFEIIDPTAREGIEDQKGRFAPFATTSLKLLNITAIGIGSQHIRQPDVPQICECLKRLKFRGR